METREGRPRCEREAPSRTTTDRKSKRQSSVREEFEARRNAAMPARHRQRLCNLRRSPDALVRLGDDPVFRAIFAEAKRRAGGGQDA